MSQNSRDTVPAYSYDILRHELLPLLLGEEEEMILYWAGKSLARRLHLQSQEELERFFNEANWGRLTLVKEKRHGRLYEIESTGTDPSRPFTLEAGVIAQAVEKDKGLLAEASCTVSKKAPLILHIAVEWDKKDPVHEAR
ncbi:DUF2507 domain-containing protein [Alkalicoccus saliphilus]|uniref:DUF2507 domain-containing protein n=1 Tax=Alkalicoccus saliphilus TaxID=200989 RepID=A0A2T4U5N6_9BACI|nr:DUF2507 domain-containing protein [Alkalicoccus saliphilus]PTL38716.1 DUF2507 domain-containing protein [Alkalicoccus saliphilus]